MRMMRTFMAGVALTAIAASAMAQFDGPAPLAWRWIQPSRVSPTASPLVDGDMVFFSLEGRVYGIERESGNQKWRFPLVDPIEGVFRQAPILVEGTIVISGDNKIMYGVTPTNGQGKWTAILPERPIGAPVAVGKYVVQALSNNSLVAVDATDGSMFWQVPYPALEGIFGQIAAFKSDFIFFNSRNELVSVNVATRRQSWKTRPLSSIPPGSAPVPMGENIIAASGPFVINFNGNTGLARWQTPVQSPIAFTPAVTADNILVTSREGNVRILDTTTGRLNPRVFNLGSTPLFRATPAGSKFIMLTGNGGINLIDPAAGTSLWTFLIRPIPASQPANPGAGGGMIGGGAPGRGGAPGGFPGSPGGGGAPGGFPGGGQGMTNTNAPAPLIVQGAAPAVLAGQTLLVPARDGSLLAFDKDLGVDFTGPRVTMAWPNSGDQVNGVLGLELLFRMEDEASGIKEDTIKVTIDGVAYDSTLARDGILEVRIGSSTTAKNKPLSRDGRREIVITAADWMGNVTKRTFSLTVDNTLPRTTRPTGNANQPGGRGGLGGGPGGNNGDN